MNGDKNEQDEIDQAEFDLQKEIELGNRIDIERENRKKNNNKRVKSKKDTYCSNCGLDGHLYKECTEPITSYGIIMIQLNDKNELVKEIINRHVEKEFYHVNDYGINITDQMDLELFCKFKNSLNFLMIRRKHTLGFLEFIRGRYEVENVEYIIHLFKQMTQQEIELISKAPFDELWIAIWGDKTTHQQEYVMSKNKFDKLTLKSDCVLGLDFYTQKIKPDWDSSEWGFPKGRRNYREYDIECAIREFKEETGIGDDDLYIFSRIAPLEENLIGTNGVNYRHIYYIGIMLKNIQTHHCLNEEVDELCVNIHEECFSMIRPYHTDKRKILSQVYIYFMNNIISLMKDKLSK